MLLHTGIFYAVKVLQKLVYLLLSAVLFVFIDRDYALRRGVIVRHHNVVGDRDSSVNALSKDKQRDVVLFAKVVEPRKLVLSFFGRKL